MSLSISCPACQRTLRVPETLLGQPVKCPGCSNRFTAPDRGEEPAPPPRQASSNVRATPRPKTPPPKSESEEPRRRDGYSDRPRSRRDRDDDYDDEDNRREPSTRGVKDAWNRVRIGIHLVMIGIWVWLGGTILASLGFLIALIFFGTAVFSMTKSSSNSAVASSAFAFILMILSVGAYYLGVLVELILRLVGYGMCMGAPSLRDSGMKPLAITAFSLSAVQVLFSCANVFVGGVAGFAGSFYNRSRGLPASYDAASTGISGISGLCAIGSFVVFLFFLRSVCNNARARELANKPIAMLIASVCFWVISVLLLVAVFCAGLGMVGSAFQSQSAQNLVAQMGAWAIILGLLFVVVCLVYLGLQVWYISILQKIRDAVASQRRRL